MLKKKMLGKGLFIFMGCAAMAVTHAALVDLQCPDPQALKIEKLMLTSGLKQNKVSAFVHLSQPIIPEFVMLGETTCHTAGHFVSAAHRDHAFFCNYSCAQSSKTIAISGMDSIFGLRHCRFEHSGKKYCQGGLQQCALQCDLN